MKRTAPLLLGALSLALACGNAAHDLRPSSPLASSSAALSAAPSASASPAASASSLLPAPSIETIVAAADSAEAAARAASAPLVTDRKAPPTLRKTPLIGLTVSGGVSLGAYEAGFLYYLTEAAKLPANKSALDLKLVTGASAGNINALLTILALCSKPQPLAQRSALWETWIRLSARDLFRPPSPADPPDSGRGAFSRAALLSIANSLEDDWSAGIDEKCDKVLAVSTTRLKGAELTLQDGFTVPRQEEKFVLRIRGRGPGKAPRVTNFVDPSNPLPAPMLPLPRDQDPLDAQLKTFGIVRDLLLASSAFPVAFPPQPLPHCLTSGRRRGATSPVLPTPASSALPSVPVLTNSAHRTATECGDQPIFSEDFIDGGVFDNTPLRLAEKLTTYLDPAGGWRTPGTLAPPGAAGYPGGFLFIDPDTTAYPLPAESTASEKLPLVPQISSFLSSFVATARSKELFTLIQESPDLDVMLSRRHFPTASGHLANFFGFFEESFRRFDFYLGMFDAHQMALRTLPEVIDPTRPDRVDTVWDPFVCMLSVLGDEDRDQSACSPDPVRCSAIAPGDCARKTRHARAFRALLQVAVDRLHSHCESLPPATVPAIEHHHCLQAALHKPRRLVKDLHQGPPGSYRRQPQEAHFEHTLRLLDLYRFRFDDLLGPDSSGGTVEAMTSIRYQLASLLERTASRQPFADAAVLRLLGKPALNFVYYAPPPTIVHISLGRGNEVGASWLSGWRRLRFSAAIQAKGIEELVFSDQGAAAFTPLIGLESELYGAAITQVRLGLRLGYQFSTAGVRTTDCRNVDLRGTFSASRSDCSSFVAQLPLAIAVFERVRFQLVPEYLVPHKPLDAKSWNVLFGVGGQLISPFSF